MTIINTSDLDAQMGRHIDPNSIPRHNGGDQGVMQGVIQRGSDTQIQDRDQGRYGTEVFSEAEVGGNNHYGSRTIITLNEAPPLLDQRDPDVVVVPTPAMPVSQAAPRPPPFLFPKAPPRPAQQAPPAPTAVAPAAPAPAPMPVSLLLAQMGLKKRS
jgi:hypothetical protein